MLKKIMLSFLILISSSLFAQEQIIVAKQISIENTEMNFFEGYDDQGSLYFVKNNVFYKKSNEELLQYKNIALGKITKIDMKNQLRIMLYYENFNTAILLDNQLNEIQKINFSQNEIPLLATALGIASQNRLWLYNSLTQQIGLYNYLKNNFQTITQPIPGILKHYQSNFNTFQWIDDKYNWHTVDLFSKIIFGGKVPQFDQIQLLNKDEIIYKKDEKLFFKNLTTNENYAIENIEKSFLNFFFKDQILSIFTSQKIINYKIAIP